MAENNYQNYIYKRPDTGKYYSLVSGVARELTDSPAEIEKQFGTNIQSKAWGTDTTGYTPQYGGGTTGGAWNLANMRNTIDTTFNTQVPKVQQVAVSPYVSPQQITQPQPQAQQPVQQLAQQPIQQPVQQPQAPTSTYTVKAGDTLSNIAGSMGVNINAISGYKSGNPNLIYPGEVLTINKPTQMAMAGTPDVPVSYADSRSQFVQPEYQQNPLWLRPGETIDAYNTRMAQLRGETYTPGLAGYPTKEQVDIAKTGLAQGKTMEEVKSDVMTQLSNVGVNTSKISESASPVTNIKTILEDVMKSMNLPDIKTRMEEYAKEVTNLKDKQAKEISEINENPWLSEGLRTKKIAAVSDKYSGMISNKTNEFDLLQGMYDDARQQAQYAATLATNIYQKDRDYLLDQMELLTKQAEIRSSAILKAGPLTTETINGFTVLRDAEGNIVSTVKPTGKLIDTQVADNIESKNQEILSSNIPKNTKNGLILTNLLSSSKIGQGTKTSLGNTLGVINAVEDLAMLGQAGKFTGVSPLNAMLNFRLPLPFTDMSIPIPFRQSLKRKGAATTEGYIEAINLKVQQWASGAALTEAQTEQVGRFTPRVTDNNAKVREKLNNLANFMLTQAKTYLQTEGITFTPQKVNLFESMDLLKGASPEQLQQLKEEGLL